MRFFFVVSSVLFAFRCFADLNVFVCWNVRNRNVAKVSRVLGQDRTKRRWPWMREMLTPLATLTARGVGLFVDKESELERAKHVSPSDAQHFIHSLLQAEEVAIRSINDHIATMPA